MVTSMGSLASAAPALAAPVRAMSCDDQRAPKKVKSHVILPFTLPPADGGQAVAACEGCTPLHLDLSIHRSS